MPEELSVIDAAVIGGGPAGSAAAILLARAGRSVALLEKRQASHDKVCGEFISAEAARYLRELGLDLAALGAQAIHVLRLCDGESVLEAALPFPAWSLSRRLLDEALLERAAQAGAALRRGVAVSGLAREGKCWTLGTAGLEKVRADAVFLASGKHELRGWPRAHGRMQERIGFKMHLRLADLQREALRGRVELYLHDGGYTGLETVEDGKVTLCCVIGRERYVSCGKNWPALMAWLASTSPHLEARLADAQCLWPRPLAIYGTPYGYLYDPHAGEPALFRLGDQMAVIPSFAGEGIAIALHSAFLAARAHEDGTDAGSYHRRARRDFKRPVRNAALVERLLSARASRRGAFLLARLLPGLVAPAIRGLRLA